MMVLCHRKAWSVRATLTVCSKVLGSQPPRRMPRRSVGAFSLPSAAGFWVQEIPEQVGGAIAFAEHPLGCTGPVAATQRRVMGLSWARTTCTLAPRWDHISQPFPDLCHNRLDRLSG